MTVIIDVHPDELLDRELRGTLTGDERVRLHEHLARCVACRMERMLRDDFAAEASLEDEALSACVSGALVAVAKLPSASEPSHAARMAARMRRSALVAAAVVLLGTGFAAAQTGLMARAIDYARARTEAVFGSKPPALSTSTRAPVARPDAPRGALDRPPALAVAASPAAEVTPPSAPEPSARSAPVFRAAEEGVPSALPPRVERAPSAGLGAQGRHAPASTRPVSRRASAPALVEAPAAVPAHSAGLVTGLERTPVREPPRASADAAAAFELANALRREGRSREAMAAYRSLAARFASEPEGRLALALAARLALDHGDPTTAVRDFDAYLESGDRALREQALAGRALAFGRLGLHTAECASFAALLAAYPSSTYATLARRRCAVGE